MSTADFSSRTQLVVPGFHVTPQLLPEELEDAKKAGFRTIINNRPDHEGGAGQPTSSELRTAANAVGLDYHYLPVPPSGYSDADAQRMAGLVASSAGPVLAFCRTGRRSAALYSRGQLLDQQR